MASELRSLNGVLGALAALSLLYGLSFVYAPQGGGTSKKPLLLSSQVEKVYELRFKGPAGTYSLKRGESGWGLLYPDGSRFPARSERVSSFLLSLSKKMSQTLVSFEPDQLSRLGLAGEGATQVSILMQRGPTLSLVVGAQDRSGTKRYILNGEGTAVAYLREDTFSWFLRSGPRSWLDLRVFPSFSGDDIQRLSFSGSLTLNGRPERADYTLRRDAQYGWKLENRTLRVKKVEAQRICSALAQLEAEDFLRDPPRGIASASIVLDLGDTRSIRLTLYPGPDLLHFSAWDDYSGRAFILGSDEVSAIFKNLDSVAIKN